MTPDLSIVIVHWNVPELLDACLRSVAAECRHSRLWVQTIVVDNASPGQEWRGVAAAWPEVQLVELAHNRGYAAGCNAGIERAAGAAVLLLNPDTELLSGALGTLWKTLHVASHVGMVAPLLLNPDGSIQSAGYRFPGMANIIFDLFPLHPRLVESPLNGRVPVGDGAQPLRVDYALGAAMMIRQDALAATGLLDEGYGMYSEEIDWARRLAEAGWTALLAPAARVVHHGGRSTGQLPLSMYETLWLSRARYFERWGSPRQRRLAGALVRVGTRLDDRHAGVNRRAANARIRDRFRSLARTSR
jgi:GT2 family glycosyltransferase